MRKEPFSNELRNMLLFKINILKTPENKEIYPTTKGRMPYHYLQN